MSSNVPFDTCGLVSYASTFLAELIDYLKQPNADWLVTSLKPHRATCFDFHMYKRPANFNRELHGVSSTVSDGRIVIRRSNCLANLWPATSPFATSVSRHTWVATILIDQPAGVADSLYMRSWWSMLKLSR
ncbi:hypothetical protein N7G274_003623 [Stereocaulon virgatum]|uniref:Uncharacterized protein n=1 Tax=Stereocaulon virgatum TaxID=373712 RepID=A0ABR4ABU2_9LECA